MRYRIGEGIFQKKSVFLDMKPNALVGPENVRHIVDMCYVSKCEKRIIKENILQEARDQGIIFEF